MTFFYLCDVCQVCQVKAISMKLPTIILAVSHCHGLKMSTVSTFKISRSEPAGDFPSFGNFPKNDLPPRFVVPWKLVHFPGLYDSI